MTKLILTLAITATIINVCWCYSGGAPEDVCEDMTPKHPAAPQTSEIPYTAIPDKKIVASGGKVKITISGKKDFKGFLLQVRDDGNKAAGQFNIDAGHKFIKTINCHGAKGNAATHKNSEPKNNLDIEWVAPAGKKSYTIYATIAEDGGVYWVQKKMANIQVE